MIMSSCCTCLQAFVFASQWQEGKKLIVVCSAVSGQVSHYRVHKMRRFAQGGDEGTTEVDRARGRLSSGMSSWIKEDRAMNTRSSKNREPTNAGARVTTGYLYM